MTAILLGVLLTLMAVAFPIGFALMGTAAVTMPAAGMDLISVPACFPPRPAPRAAWRWTSTRPCMH
ncbi:MAG TPA: hypothetical protein VFM11_04005 [Burkholderiales bacterium]|nr:hypothetical protein [Burkholderiales bacterium]